MSKTPVEIQTDLKETSVCVITSRMWRMNWCLLVSVIVRDHMAILMLKQYSVQLE